MSSTSPYDVVVAGGGPAASATAIWLARNGRSVALFEWGAGRDIPVGETLPPDIKVVLQKLGAWSVFLEGSPVPSPGTLAAWDTPALRETDFIANPYGDGWHVDRQRFDSGLLRVASRLGVTVLPAHKLTAAPAWNGETWTVPLVHESGGRAVAARFLVDATGANAVVSQRLGVHKVFHDRLAAVLHLCACHGDMDGPTLVEASEEGWWYSAPLPHHQLLIAYLTDADLLPRTKDAAISESRRLIVQVPHTLGRLAPNVSHIVRTAIVSARSSILNTVPATPWFAAGDAVASFDPLSGSGVSFALQSGIRAAEAICDSLSATAGSAMRYSTWTRATFRNYLANRASYYSRVERWPHSVFWQRRRGVSARKSA